MQPQPSTSSGSDEAAFYNAEEIGHVASDPIENTLEGLRRNQMRGSPSLAEESIASSAVELDTSSNPGSTVRTQDVSPRGSELPLFARLRSSAPLGYLRKLAELPKVYGLSESDRERIRRKNMAFIVPKDFGSGSNLGNRIVIAAVGTFGKILLSKLNFLKTYRMEVLYDAIENREKGKGLLTVSNHKSVIDDPLLLSAFLPPRILYRPSLMRWGVCSLDICFQTRFYASVCALGKTLPMKRFGGLSQKYLHDAAGKLFQGHWVHIYPEGRVRQRGMGYMKRGLGKMIAMTYAETGGLPVILPLYHEGIEQVMPHDRETNRLKSMIPRIGKKMFAIAGDPVDVGHIVKRMMPACEKAGGVSKDAPECLRMYEELADFLGMSIRLLRIELRKRVLADHNVNLGDPYEIS